MKLRSVERSFSRTPLKRGAALLAVALLVPASAHARNDVLRLPIARAMEVHAARANLAPMPMYFGNGKAPEGANLGEISTSNKTNAVGKSDEAACGWVLMSALKALQSLALKRGANVLVNIRSNYQNSEFSSPSEFECGAGTIMAGVALKAIALRVDGPLPTAAPVGSRPASSAPPSVAPGSRPAAGPSAAAIPATKPSGKAEASDGLGGLGAQNSETDQLAEARKRFDKGQRLYDLRRYNESIPEFEAAYELSGDPVLLYNLAQAYRMIEKYPDALHYYRAYLKKVPKSPRTELVRKRIAELEATQEPPNNVDEPSHGK